MSQTLQEVLNRFPERPEEKPLPAPLYREPSDILSLRRIGLAVESMKRHMTDEGWQIFEGLEHAGYALAGRHLPYDEVNVLTILGGGLPSVVVVQDKREWDTRPGEFRDQSARFLNVSSLSSRDDIFKLTILKDSHQRPNYHRESAQEIGCHAWIVYYHPDIVCRLAPYVRGEHLVRTYHTVDPHVVPDFSARREEGCLLSGASSGAYPLRRKLIQSHVHLPRTNYMKHPGYHRKGCATPGFLRSLSNHKVAICTASIYGYALRKIIEATACGCVVITDLPEEEVLPEIDENLVRVHPRISPREVADLLRDLYASYDPERQYEYAQRAIAFYDFRAAGIRLAQDIENLRGTYNAHTTAG